MMTYTTFEIPQKNAEPRLKPIDKPKSLKLKLTYWYTKRLLGKVITPLKVHYARFPEALGLSRTIMKTRGKIYD